MKDVNLSFHGDKITEDINVRLRKTYLATLCKRPAKGVTEVRLRIFIIFILFSRLGLFLAAYVDA